MHSLCGTEPHPSAPVKLVEITFIAAALTYYTSMILLITDRFSSVFFHLRYEVMFLKRRIKLIVIIAWFASALLSALVYILYQFDYVTYACIMRVMFRYVYIPIDVFILVLTCSS